MPACWTKRTRQCDSRHHSCRSTRCQCAEPHRRIASRRAFAGSPGGLWQSIEFPKGDPAHRRLPRRADPCGCPHRPRRDVLFRVPRPFQVSRFMLRRLRQDRVRGRDSHVTGGQALLGSQAPARQNLTARRSRAADRSEERHGGSIGVRVRPHRDALRRQPTKRSIAVRVRPPGNWLPFIDCRSDGCIPAEGVARRWRL